MINIQAKMMIDSVSKSDAIVNDVVAYNVTTLNNPGNPFMGILRGAKLLDFDGSSVCTLDQHI